MTKLMSCLNFSDHFEEHNHHFHQTYQSLLLKFLSLCYIPL
uniref:Uncharacterized protein n=1 Tax=Arundo donax TaxID=35708 RepID=A0A0A9AXI1_ARUDO